MQGDEGEPHALGRDPVQEFRREMQTRSGRGNCSLNGRIDGLIIGAVLFIGEPRAPDIGWKRHGAVVFHDGLHAHVTGRCDDNFAVSVFAGYGESGLAALRPKDNKVSGFQSPARPGESLP